MNGKRSDGLCDCLQASRSALFQDSLFCQASKLRTALQAANTKSEAEAEVAADYKLALHQQLSALYDSSLVNSAFCIYGQL